MSHPVLVLIARAKTRQALRAQGKGLLESFHLADQVNDDVVSTAVSLAPPEAQAKVGAVGAIGDGSIIKFITDFLSSDLGKAIIAIIISLITGA